MKHIINTIHILFLVLFVILILNGKMMLWLGIYGISLIVALIFGRVYCGYICPMNTLMIPTESFSKKMKWQTDNTPKWLKSGKLPWFALLGSVITMVLSKKILEIDLPIMLIWLGASVIITLRYKPAVFHNLICPFGALQKVFGKFAIISHRVNKEDCIGCKICEKVCPSDAIIVKTEDKKAEVNTSLCLQCSNCIIVCPKDTIYYSKEIKTKVGNT